MGLLILLAGCYPAHASKQVTTVTAPEVTSIPDLPALTATPAPSPTEAPSSTPSPIPPTPSATPTTILATATLTGAIKDRLGFWADNVDGTWIYTISVDKKSTQPDRLGKGQEPSWSPDGNQVAFVEYLGNGKSQIDVMNSDGTHRQPITHARTYLSEPAWSPDGKWIAYSYFHKAIYKMKPDGSAQTLVVDGSVEFEAYAPAWSPDSKRIAFLTSLNKLTATLVIANSDGAKPREITQRSDLSSPVSWSPDGLWIAYGCLQDETVQICVIHPDGSGKKVLTSQGRNTSPRWSPDGEWIAFCSSRDSISDVYIMRPDGSMQQRVTEDRLVNYEPAWIP